MVTSGGFGPTVNAPSPWATSKQNSSLGTEVLRGRRDHACRAAIAALPFVPHRYVR